MDSRTKLAVDIGGPIIRAPGGSAPDVYRNAQPTRGCFAGLRTLSRRRFGDAIHLISQCDEQVQAAKLDWFRAKRFHTRTGVTPDRVHFVRKPEDKAALCKELGVTHFVDDRPHILMHALGVVPNLFVFNPDPAELGRHPLVAVAAREVVDWDALLRILLA